MCPNTVWKRIQMSSSWLEFKLSNKKEEIGKQKQNVYNEK